MKPQFVLLDVARCLVQIRRVPKAKCKSTCSEGPDTIVLAIAIHAWVAETGCDRGDYASCLCNWVIMTKRYTQFHT